MVWTVAVTIEIFLQKTKNIAGLARTILLLGDEDYYLDRAGKRIRELVFAQTPPAEIDYGLFFVEKLNDAASLTEFREQVLSGGFFASARLFIISDCSIFKADKQHTQALLTLLQQLPEETFCVFVLNRLEGSMRGFKDYTSRSLYKWLDDKGQVVNCLSPRYYEIKPWLTNELKERRVKLEPAAVETIMNYCSQTDTVNLNLISNELGKLELTYGSDTLITNAQLLAVSRLGLQVSTFRLVDYLFRKEVRAVADITRELLDQNIPLEMIVALLSGQIKKALQLKLFEAAGHNISDFAKMTRTNEYVANNLRKNTRQLQVGELKKLFGALVDLLHKVRTGQKSAADLLPILVVFCQG